MILIFIQMCSPCPQRITAWLDVSIFFIIYYHITSYQIKSHRIKSLHIILVLFCFVLFCFVLFCFVLFCFVLFCFVLFCFKFPFKFIFIFIFIFYFDLLKILQTRTENDWKGFASVWVRRDGTSLMLTTKQPGPFKRFKISFFLFYLSLPFSLPPFPTFDSLPSLYYSPFLFCF